MNIERVRENFAEQLRNIIEAEQLWRGQEAEARYDRKIAVLFIDRHFSVIAREERERIFSRVFATQKLRRLSQVGKEKVTARR